MTGGGRDVGQVLAAVRGRTGGVLLLAMLTNTVTSYSSVLSFRRNSYDVRCHMGFICSEGVTFRSTFTGRMGAMALCTFSSRKGFICRGARRNRSELKAKRCAVSMSVRPNSCRLMA